MADNFTIRDFNAGTAKTIRATDNSGVLTPHHTIDAGTASIGKVGIDLSLTDGSYETVAASQTDQVMGATGATGDYLAGVLIVPATTSPGAVSIKDGAGSAIAIFTGGTVASVVPFFVALGIKSTAGAWKLTTGTNVSCIGVGRFT